MSHIQYICLKYKDKKTNEPRYLSYKKAISCVERGCPKLRSFVKYEEKQKEVDNEKEKVEPNKDITRADKGKNAKGPDDWV